MSISAINQATIGLLQDCLSRVEFATAFRQTSNEDCEKSWETQIGSISYIFCKTQSGFVIQPKVDFKGFKRSGCFISKDFTHIQDDGKETTGQAIAALIDTLFSRPKRARMSSPEASSTASKPAAAAAATVQAGASAPMKGACSAEQGYLGSASSIMELDPNKHGHSIKDSNKLFIYHSLVDGQSVGDVVTFSKFSFSNPQTIASQAVFHSKAPSTLDVEGSFRYDPSTDTVIHWTANFAHSQLFDFCGTYLLAQDEIQVVEHPSLAHIKQALPLDQRTLKRCEVALFENVSRLGSLDTLTPVAATGCSLYGDGFVCADEAMISSKLERFPTPTKSHIFAMAAPHIKSHLAGKPYQQDDLETLFFTSYNAFRAIREKYPTQKVVIHSGNWGAGAFGNDLMTTHLMQLAAARVAGVDELRMYPMTNKQDLEKAKALLNQIEKDYPDMTVGQFLQHLFTQAASYNLRYRLGNGT